MVVERDGSNRSLAHAGSDFFFCSDDCLKRFRRNPDSFLSILETPNPEVSGAVYICPMHPEIRQDRPGTCPECGMALEPETPISATRTDYICPMHPEVVSEVPASCPICGMALEPRTITLEAETNPELEDMSRRFWGALALTLPVFVVAMGEMIPGQPLESLASKPMLAWIQFILATPVVLWAGWPFFERGWQSFRALRLNMFTLIAIGTGAAYGFSVAAMLFPGVFPDSFRSEGGSVQL